MPVLNERIGNDAEEFVYVGYYDPDLDSEPEDGCCKAVSRRSSTVVRCGGGGKQQLREHQQPSGEHYNYCSKADEAKCCKQQQQITAVKPCKPKSSSSAALNGIKMATPSGSRSEDVLASSPTNSELNSICHLRTSELFPKPKLEMEDPGLTIPFTPICGEAGLFVGRTQDGILSMSNYRIYHRSSSGAVANIPLMLVETADIRDLFYLHIMCKDARSLRCIFSSGEQCIDWQRRITSALLPPDSLEKFFAFSYKAWAAESGGEEVLKRLSIPRHLAFGSQIDPHEDFRKEVSRLEFNIHGTWRVSEVNSDYNLCPSYPPLLLVPKNVTDKDLEIVAKFRSSRRIPAVVWRHKGNGAIIARCSQPEVGWLGWRSNEDEQLVASLAASCQDASSIGSAARKLLIVDARSYASAVTNRARGGGSECNQYYPCAEIQFMCLPNIHSVRKSFQALRALAAEPADHANWHSVLEKSLWLQAVGGLLRAATLIARAVHVGGRPTLVHCSDGWDRTPQIVSTAQLLLDPYYRTCEGFRILVEREWLDFGHKFADRCGHTVGSEDLNERCPVFLQWLDCVHQILVQYPCSFEFSQSYLIKLAQHAYSCLFGTFLCNNRREREHQKVAERTFSIWNFLRGPDYYNHLYKPNREVLYPAHSARALVVWSAVYLGVAPDTPASAQPPVSPPPPAHTSTFSGTTSNGVMTKTRSYQDLSTLSDHNCTTYRRSSDPNILIDAMTRSTLSLSGVNNNDAREMGRTSMQTSDDCPVQTEGAEEANDRSVTPENNDEVISDQNKQGIHDCFANNIDEDAIEDKHQRSVNGVCLKNSTVSKQTINGFSYKANGNIVPVLNSDSDSLIMKDSNFNSKHVDEIDSVKYGQNGVYENGNTMMSGNILSPDSPDQLEGKDFIEQAIDTVAEPQKILDDIPYRPVGNAVSSPMEDSIMFCNPNYEATSCIGIRTRNESATWRSESECSQQTDSSCVDLVDYDYINNSSKPNSLRRQRLDSVQNGGLNDSAATLLESEIASTFNQQSNSVPNSFSNHRRNKSDGASNIGSFNKSIPIEASESTVCPNSPHRAFHRTQSIGASSGLGYSHTTCQPDNATQALDHRSENCCLANLHHHDCHSCTATHHVCLLHCLTHCTHSKQSHIGYTLGNVGARLDPVDGLVCPQSPVQQRLHQIILDYKMIEEGLRKELLAARLELQQRNCRTARPTPDHTESLNVSNANSTENVSQFDNDSVVDSMRNNYGNPYNLSFDDVFGRANDNWDYYPHSDSSSGTGEESIGGNGALLTGNWMDLSAINNGGRAMSASGNRVLWVPDHAVSRCTRCETAFWLGKRKHHCRCCGRIFCAECSEKTTPIPNEKLYNPVRVCTECYSSLMSSLSSEERNAINEQNAKRAITKSKQSPVMSVNNHSNSTEIRTLSDSCKQVSGEQKIKSSPVTAASN